jgi:hypothetical protein
MPLYMRLGKLRGNTSKDAMPVGPFRTSTLPVNVRDLERFDAGTDVTPELLKEAGLVPHLRHDVKILGEGELTKTLNVTAHRFSASARGKIEAAGGTVNALVQPKPKKARPAKPAPPADEAPAPEAEAEAEPEAPAEAEAEEPETSEE